MPLPEHEQRQLQQIEQALYRDDPKFGRRMRASDPRMRYQRTLLQALPGVVIGVGLFEAGAVTHRVYLAAVGMMIMLLSLVWAVVSWRRYVARVGSARSRAGTKTAKGTKHRSGQTWRARMMERMKSAGVAARRVTAGCRGGPGADTRVDRGGTASP